ncbi:Single Ig IL-1-related receptor [Plecturocebus cupreus]
MAAASDLSRCPVQLTASREESCRALGSGCLAKDPCGAGGSPRAQPALRRPWLRAIPAQGRQDIKPGHFWGKTCQVPVPVGLVGRHGVTSTPNGGLVSSCTVGHCGGGGAGYPGTADPVSSLSRFKANLSEGFVSSVLGVNVTSAEDYGTFTSSIQNVSSSSFTLQRAGLASHVAAVLASLLVLLALLLAAVLYVKCRLNVLLWHQDAYGEVEMNAAGLFGARAPGADDVRALPRVDTCKPPQPGPQTPSSDFWKELQLALPRKVHYRPVEGEPQMQLQQDKDPMLILQGRVPEGRALDEGDLSMPIQPHSGPEKLSPGRSGGSHRAEGLGLSWDSPCVWAKAVGGHLRHLGLPSPGVPGPVFGEPSAPPSTGGVLLGEGRGSEVDVSDLGLRNYSARTDFYCLVSKDDM